MRKILVLIYVLACGFYTDAFAQEEKSISGGIVNGKAIYLPKPEYSQEAKDFCADGKVKVKVLIGEDGSVLEATAISGDEFLQVSAVEAAKQAKFSPINHNPVKVRGILIYDFVLEKKCFSAKTVNSRAISIPKPKIANLKKLKHFQIKNEEVVEVRIVIDSPTGKVLFAKAISGHSLFRAACEESALQAKFYPTNDVPPFKIKALLVYKFKPNGRIEF